MTEFYPVWLSTEEQLGRLADAYIDASALQKSLGRFQFPSGTAHLRGVVMPWARIPLAYTSQGRLTFVGTAIRFRAAPPQLFGWRVREVDTTVSFELRANEIQLIEPFTFASPVATLFDVPFTRVRTTKSGFAGDFLICVGGKIHVPRIRTRSLALQEALTVFRSAALTSPAT